MNSEKFWINVYKTNGCWFWCAARNKKGYGAVRFFSATRLSHHVSWFLTYGKWPNKWLLHKCDTPQCVNPNHLFEGSREDNEKDSAAKGIDRFFEKSARDTCTKGHPRTKENTYIIPKTGHRQCRICMRNNSNSWKKKVGYKSRRSERITKRLIPSLI